MHHRFNGDDISVLTSSMTKLHTTQTQNIHGAPLNKQYCVAKRVHTNEFPLMGINEVILILHIFTVLLPLQPPQAEKMLLHFYPRINWSKIEPAISKLSKATHQACVSAWCGAVKLLLRFDLSV